eukprot:Sdes_comp20900_c1_seq2m18062
MSSNHCKNQKSNHSENPNSKTSSENQNSEASVSCSQNDFMSHWKFRVKPRKRKKSTKEKLGKKKKKKIETQKYSPSTFFPSDPKIDSFQESTSKQETEIPPRSTPIKDSTPVKKNSSNVSDELAAVDLKTTVKSGKECFHHWKYKK